MPVLLVLSRLQGAGVLFDRQNSGFSHFTSSLLRFTLRLPVILMLSHPGICLQCWVTCGPTASLGTLITICCCSYPDSSRSYNSQRAPSLSFRVAASTCPVKRWFACDPTNVGSVVATQSQRRFFLATKARAMAECCKTSWDEANMAVAC